MQPNSKILITGASGMVGSALVRAFTPLAYHLFTPTHAELDLRNQNRVLSYFEKNKFDYVFHLAAIVGGIHANHHFPAKFIYDNTLMQSNVIHSAFECGVKKLMLPGSACTYPKLAEQPIKETAFLDGKIEPTNIAYAAAKINGIVMAQSFAREHQFNVITPMPTNAYGVGDNFDPQASHVIPALMKRFHDAKTAKLAQVTLWGSGTPLREFIYVDDLADALIFLMQEYDSYELINVGTMQEIAIFELAKAIATIVGFEGEIELDPSKPDGAPRKCLDSSPLFTLGWQPRTDLLEGLTQMYRYHFGVQRLTA
ncbi:MAG: GDP-L-fucose synthase [Gammaproteobacteria bacterium]|nr:GDP-L-fucose synthase [Gammaproteobacteria bacterium]